MARRQRKAARDLIAAGMPEDYVSPIRFILAIKMRFPYRRVVIRVTLDDGRTGDMVNYKNVQLVNINSVRAIMIATLVLNIVYVAGHQSYLVCKCKCTVLPRVIALCCS